MDRVSDGIDRPPNIALERSAGSRSLAAAAQRRRSRDNGGGQFGML
jgi:hypothetical protein